MRYSPVNLVGQDIRKSVYSTISSLLQFSVGQHYIFILNLLHIDKQEKEKYIFDNFCLQGRVIGWVSVQFSISSLHLQVKYHSSGGIDPFCIFRRIEQFLVPAFSYSQGALGIYFSGKFSYSQGALGSTFRGNSAIVRGPWDLLFGEIQL